MAAIQSKHILQRKNNRVGSGVAGCDYGNGGKPLARNCALAAVLFTPVEVDVEVEAGIYDPLISFPKWKA